MWHRSQSGSAKEAAKEMAHDSAAGAKGVKESTKSAVEAVEQKVNPSS